MLKQKLRKKFLMMATVSLIAFSPVGLVAQQIQPSNVDAAQISDAMAQTAGSYDTINLSYLTSLGMQQKAWNDPMQHLGEGQLKPGYSRYIWTPDVVLPIRLREGMMTLINLPAWELIEKVHIGSPESFGGEIAAPNSLLLYADPTYIGVDSNLIIFGRSGNRYVFYLRSETYNTDRITNSVVDVLVGPNYTPVSAGGVLNISGGASVTVGSSGSKGSAPGWSGMGGNSLTPGGAQSPNLGLNTAGNAPKNWLESIPVDPEKFRFDIDVFIPNPEDIDIAPERVWRDEIFTYIDLGPKALNMTQRPIVNLIVQGSEVPVGSRTKGPHSRLIVVEGIGDMILRNGQKVVCLKLRRDPAQGLEYVDYSASNERTWYAEQPSTTAGTQPIPANKNQGMLPVTAIPQKQDLGNLTVNGVPVSNPYAPKEDNYTHNMLPLPNDVRMSQYASSGIVNTMNGMDIGKPNTSSFQVPVTDNIAIELAQDNNIGNLEDRWESIRSKNKDLLQGYNPYFSVDAVAEGGVPELFRLRIGPIQDIQTGDALCDKLSRKGITCSVIRTQ